MTIEEGTFGEERRPTSHDPVEHLIGAHDVEEGVLLPGEAGCLAVLATGTGSHGDERVLTESRICLLHLSDQIVSKGGCGDDRLEIGCDPGAVVVITERSS